MAPIESKFVRVSGPDDPERCQGKVDQGLCPYKAEPGLLFCPRCKGQSNAATQNLQLRNYRLTKFQAQIQDKLASPNIKSLREEIGIARQVLEEVINKCQTAQDLFIYSNKITDLITRVEKLVVSCHKLEKSSSELLDKSTLINLAKMFTEIIADYVNETVQREISNKLISTIITIQNEPTD